MLGIVQSEWFKLRKTKVFFILLVGPAVALFAGLSIDPSQAAYGINSWYMILLVMNFAYSLLFLPLITGVLASNVCRYEHQAGGWKQLLALPVTRGKVFVAKYAMVMMLILVIQLLFLVALLAAGFMKGISDSFPSDIVWRSILGGWVATLPLVALQLWLSIMMKTFAGPFVVNVIFTLPALIAINEERIGAYYPWAQPFTMMYVGGETGEMFYIPWEQLILVIGGSFLLFFLGGFIYFQRKSV